MHKQLRKMEPRKLRYTEAVEAGGEEGVPYGLKQATRVLLSV